MQKRRNDVNILITYIYLHTIPPLNIDSGVTLSLSSTENAANCSGGTYYFRQTLSREGNNNEIPGGPKILVSNSQVIRSGFWYFVLLGSCSSSVGRLTNICCIKYCISIFFILMFCMFFNTASNWKRLWLLYFPAENIVLLNYYYCCNNSYKNNTNTNVNIILLYNISENKKDGDRRHDKTVEFRPGRLWVGLADLACSIRRHELRWSFAICPIWLVHSDRCVFALKARTRIAQQHRLNGKKYAEWYASKCNWKWNPLATAQLLHWITRTLLSDNHGTRYMQMALQNLWKLNEVGVFSQLTREVLTTSVGKYCWTRTEECLPPANSRRPPPSWAPS